VKTTILSIFAATAIASSSYAQDNVEKRYSREFNQCANDSGGSDPAMVDCYSSEIDRQDARLNQAYVMVMRGLPTARKTALRQSERAWIQQRDLGCKRNAKFEEGGTLYNVIYSGCLLDETIKRIIFLERYR